MKPRSLADRWRFFCRFTEYPSRIGAIAPSSDRLARAMAAEINPLRGGPVLELGPGTGVVTRALIARGFAPERITAVEFDSVFASVMVSRYPGVHVVWGDAFDLETTLGPAQSEVFDAVICSIPLLNHSPARRLGLIGAALARAKPGAPLILFSYGMTPPVPVHDGIAVRRASVVWRNLPPARVWVYRRTS